MFPFKCDGIARQSGDTGSSNRQNRSWRSAIRSREGNGGQCVNSFATYVAIREVADRLHSTRSPVNTSFSFSLCHRGKIGSHSYFRFSSWDHFPRLSWAQVAETFHALSSSKRTVVRMGKNIETFIFRKINVDNFALYSAIFVISSRMLLKSLFFFLEETELFIGIRSLEFKSILVISA